MSGDGFDLTYLSLGAGVQSSALLAMSCLGLYGCPKVDAAVFADTGGERAGTLRQVEILRAFAAPYGVPVETVSAGSLEKHLLGQEVRRRAGFQVSIPAHSGMNKRGGLLRRQCTREFKIDPLKKWARTRLGLLPRQRAAGRFKVRCLIGISRDEIQRMKPSLEAWVENCYPLIDARLRREDCLAILDRAKLPRPVKSACVFCPYHDTATWADLKKNFPEEFARAVAVDEKIRDLTAVGAREPCYLHRSRRPLAEIDFAAMTAEDDARRKSQGVLWDSFSEECTGICGV